MKRLLAVVLAVVVVLSLGATVALAGKAETGNGAPSGAHYNLNLIGVPKDKTADMTGSNGHVIFVKLYGSTKIWLTEGDFMVLDKNGTDSDGASFQLPNPDPDNTGYTEYSVYARALGKPGGSGTITPGFYDEYGNEWLSVENVIVERVKGKSIFDNVSRELLYVWVDVDLDGDIDRVPLFDDRFQDYFWQYDNNGCKLVQLRFYDITSGPFEDPEPVA